MKVYPVNNGNHDNIYFLAKLKGIFTFKIICLNDSQKAYILTHSLNINVHKEIYDIVNNSVIYSLIQRGLAKFDFILVTDSQNIFKRRNELETKVYIKTLY